MHNVLQVVLFSLFSIFLIGCQGEGANSNSKKASYKAPTLPIPTDQYLVDQVEMNLRGLTSEDTYEAMYPLDLTSPYMQGAEKAIRGAFMVYEMEFRLHDVQITEKTDTACYAIVEHDSRNHNERTYSPQRSKQRYTWKPVNGEWKIHMMEVLGSSPINY